MGSPSNLSWAGAAQQAAVENKYAPEYLVVTLEKKWSHSIVLASASGRIRFPEGEW
jgi:hypothetical protein